MASGASRLTVTAVTSEVGIGRPVASATLTPVRLARRSHRAQSRALRAAPGVSRARAAPSSPSRQNLERRLQLGQHAVDGLVVAAVGHALAAPTWPSATSTTTTSAAVLTPREMRNGAFSG
jgi:hypothetical protein